jgi:hypothetical protein
MVVEPPAVAAPPTSVKPVPPTSPGGGPMSGARFAVEFGPFMTAPEAERWRSYGVFRAPLPLPAGHVSWRDQFLLMAGRDPHPFLNQ